MKEGFASRQRHPRRTDLREKLLEKTSDGGKGQFSFWIIIALFPDIVAVKAVASASGRDLENEIRAVHRSKSKTASLMNGTALFSVRRFSLVSLYFASISLKEGAASLESGESFLAVKPAYCFSLSSIYL